MVGGPVVFGRVGWVAPLSLGARVSRIVFCLSDTQTVQTSVGLFCSRETFRFTAETKTRVS